MLSKANCQLLEKLYINSKKKYKQQNKKPTINHIDVCKVINPSAHTSLSPAASINLHRIFPFGKP